MASQDNLNLHHTIVNKRTTELLKKIASWKVVEYDDNIFKDLTYFEVQHMLSAYQENHSKKIAKKSSPFIFKSFDPRQIFSDCTHEIIDQGTCGSSYAIATAHALGDRFCRSGKREAARLSPQPILSCDTQNFGCTGGYVYNALQFLQEYGSVTEDCVPYSSYNGRVEECPHRCRGGGYLNQYACKKDTIRELSYDIEGIKEEIATKGPIGITMAIYDDFMYYQSGIYRHIYGKSPIGRHAVRLIGYGVQNGENFWICANSWTESWGEEGYFRIAFGECEVEEDVWTCDPM